LLPVRVTNFLPACKNLGVTHITNGCYRLHPVEWNIGESAGLLAAFCLKQKTQPHAVREKNEIFGQYQTLLKQQGIELTWPKAAL
ncbi:MAG TPA: FAD-dependent oxidoreductase, partial [Tepidisphaeraceae bacterium]|nr:FAD-dependent oxidoreductase [Tepidisphaeraceae bacterium]